MVKSTQSPKTGDITLRDVTQEDLEVFFIQQLDGEANEMAGFRPRTREAFMRHWAKVLANETNYTQTIVYEGEVAGNVVSFLMEGQREVGYWIGKEFWGKGIASQALRLFLEQVRERPLYGHVAKHNGASRRVLEKCGFVVEREGRSEFFPGGGEVEEVVLILKSTAENTEYAEKKL